MRYKTHITSPVVVILTILACIGACDTSANSKINNMYMLARDYSAVPLVEKQQSALYLQNCNTCDNDNPAIVISSKQPNPEIVSAMFSGCGGNENNIKIFVVDAKTMKWIVEQIPGVLVPKTQDWPNRKRDTYDMGVFNRGDVYVRSLAISQFVPALWVIQKAAQNKYGRLYEAISELKSKHGFPAKLDQNISKKQAIRISKDDFIKDRGSKNLVKYKMTIEDGGESWIVKWCSIKQNVKDGRIKYVIRKSNGMTTYGFGD